MNALTLDEELQPRASIDRTVLENYVQLLVDGVRFPPVVAFNDGSVTWLSDGFHRWHSRRVLDLDDIEVDVRDGTRRDALLFSLSANAKHGLQRGSTDYSRAYEIACRNGLVDPTNIEAVAALLQCSGSWATKLTESARAAAKAARDAEIIRLDSEGKGSRAIARETGIPETTVRRVTAPKSDNVETAQPLLTETARENLQRIFSPEAQRWHRALEALRFVNQQAPVDEMFEERYTRIDHAIAPELEAAHKWINDLYRRFVSEQAQRRRA